LKPALSAPRKLNWRIQTDTDWHLLAGNTNGEHHLVLLFDLEAGHQAMTARLMR